MIGSGERCSSSNQRIRGNNSTCSMNSSENVGGQRKKRWVSPKCYCGSHAILFMSGTENNPDRLFFRCPYFKTAEAHCSFFAWLDDYISSFNEYAVKTISKGILTQKQNRFEGLSDAVDEKVKELEDRLIGLENQLEKSRLEIGESRCLGLGCSVFALFGGVVVAFLLKTTL